MFQLTEVAKVVCTNANPRRELHGKELVRAIDLTFNIQGDNTLLDLIEPGLRARFFHSKALDARQETVEGIEVPLPDLRHPNLPTESIAYEQKKCRGYRWIWDWGIEGDHVDFTDCAIGSLKIVKIKQGGSCALAFTVSYNGEELNDNALYGELSGLASEGEVYIKLLAPPELMPVKKGAYRAGKPDTPQTPAGGDGQGELGEGDDDQQDGDSEGGADDAYGGEPDALDPATPEGALANSSAGDDTQVDQTTKRGQGRRTAADVE